MTNVIFVGIGTALKILFSSEDPSRWQFVEFRRSEIIALYNTLGRTSESIVAVQKFREFHENMEKQVLYTHFASDIRRNILYTALPAFSLISCFILSFL
jgi:hypothetical protein